MIVVHAQQERGEQGDAAQHRREQTVAVDRDLEYAEHGVRECRIGKNEK